MSDHLAPADDISAVYVAPALLAGHSADELSDALTKAGLGSRAEVNEALGVRGAADEILIALSTSGADILIGAAGAAVWDAVLAVFPRLLRPKDGKCRIVLQYKDESISADLDLTGAAAEITDALHALPALLRKKTPPKTDGGT